MKNKSILITMLVLILIFSIFAQKKEKFLVRVDLLKLKQKVSKLEKKRNIFSWKTISKKGYETEKSNKEMEHKSEKREKSDLETVLLPDIRYIGFVSSKKKILGIIIYGKEEFIVREGDLIENIGKVKKITPEEIEIVLNNSKIIKIPIQEEEEFIF